MWIRRFKNEDAIKVSKMIADTLRHVNIKDYSKEYIEKDVATLSPEYLIERASWMHLYVVCEGEDIIGCGV